MESSCSRTSQLKAMLREQSSKVTRFENKDGTVCFCVQPSLHDKTPILMFERMTKYSGAHTKRIEFLPQDENVFVVETNLTCKWACDIWTFGPRDKQFIATAQKETQGNPCPCCGCWARWQADVLPKLRSNTEMLKFLKHRPLGVRLREEDPRLLFTGEIAACTALSKRAGWVEKRHEPPWDTACTVFSTRRPRDWWCNPDDAMIYKINAARTKEDHRCVRIQFEQMAFEQMAEVD